MIAQTDLGWIAHSILHGSGWGCVLRVEAHFDESGTDAAEITLAGYLFEAERIDPFGAQWNEVLARYDVPYFHMVDCAHGAKPFEKLDKINRIKLQMQLMALIKRYAINGIVCNITNVPDNAGASYLEGVKGAVKVALDWADKAAYSGKIGYFFEAGASGQGLAEVHFGEIAKDPASSAAHRYAGHAFVPKLGNPGVQAADLLAWQYHNFTKKRATASLARLDMRALLRHPHHISDQCGDPPREPKIQSVRESRDRIETVHYLPKAKPGVKYAEIHPEEDFTAFSGSSPGATLACPNCFRAVAENCPPKMFSDIVIRCWCGTRCLIPPMLPPFVRY